MMFGTVLLAAHLFAQDTTTPAQSGNTGAADVTSSTSPLQTTNFTGFEVVNRGGGKDLGLYPDQILTVVRAKWNRLISKLEISGRKPGITLLTASIRSDGSLKAVKTVESSGDVALDDAATQAVTEPASFPRFPADYHEKELEMRFHFGYSQPGHDVQFCGEHPVSSKKYPSTPSGSGPVNPPSPTFAPDPEYGDQARRAKYQSIVVLGGIVDTDGSFRDLCIRQAAGEGLDEKAIEAASQWKFKPANRGGEPVAVYIEMEVNFRLY
jgi:TonB family protein